ncbi:uncharacterized protein LOC121317261 [Polyodon spathula]|uniref:uncharacterized protein LOC121317261 n=1 Tax=Polyodon spathula TaxID=7913 RepID=UPI001B7F400C|nr:uncharacterized protein LOC121317261 [Polyodon spathula]
MESEEEYLEKEHDQHSQRITTPNAVESEEEYLEKEHDQHSQMITTPNAVESEEEYLEKEHDQHSQRITTPNAVESEEEYLEKEHDQHSQRITTPNAVESEEEYLEKEHDQHSQMITTPNAVESEEEYLEKEHDQHSQRITTPTATGSEEEYLENSNLFAVESEIYLKNSKHDQYSPEITTAHATESEEEYLEKEHDQHSQRITTPNAVESEEEYLEKEHDQHSQRITTPTATGSEEEYLENSNLFAVESEMDLKNSKHDQYSPEITTAHATESEEEYLEKEHDQHSQRITTPNAVESEEEYLEKEHDQHSQRITTPTATGSEEEYLENSNLFAVESEMDLKNSKHDQYSPEITTPNAIESEEEYLEKEHDQHSQRITTPNAVESEEEYLENSKLFAVESEIDLKNSKHDQYSQEITTAHATESEAESSDHNRDKHSQRITTPINAMESEEEYIESYNYDQHAIESETEYLENYKHDRISQRITTPINAMESETEYVENSPDQHPRRITTNAMEKVEYRANYKNDLRAVDNEVEYQDNIREQHSSNAKENEQEYLEHSNLFPMESEMDLKNYKYDQHSLANTTPNAMESEDKYVGNGTDYQNVIVNEPEYINSQHPRKITTQNAVGSEEENLENNKPDHPVIASYMNEPFLQTTAVSAVQDTSLLRTVHFDTFLTPLQSKLPEIQSEAFDFANLDATAALDLSGNLDPTRVQSFSLISKVLLGMHDTSSEERFVIDAQPLNKARLEDIDGVCSSCDSSRVSVVGTSGKDVAGSFLSPTLLFANKFKQSEIFADESNSASYLQLSTADYLNTFKSNQAIEKIHNTIEVSQVVLESRFESLDGEDHELSPIFTNRDSNYTVNGDQTGYVTPGLLEGDSEIDQQLKFTTDPSESLKQDGIEVQIQTGKLWTSAAWEESIGTTDGSSINRNEINSLLEKRMDGASPLQPIGEDQTSIARALNFSDDKTSAYRSHRNVTLLAHFPGEYLFEVSIEMQINLTGRENLKDLERTLLTLLENLIKDDLKHLHPPKSITLKRVKRLKSGLVYILWLHFGFGERTMHMSIQSCLQRLVNRPVVELETKNALVSSVSTEDVNECSTEMLLCDAHADCFNEFGTYTCRCQEGFEDRSRAGSGGTICVNVAGSKSPTLLETLTGFGFVLIVFLLFFMVVVAVVYKRQQQGTFVVHCENLESAVLQQCLQTHGCGLNQKDDVVEPKECDSREGLPLTSFEYFCGSERIVDGMSGNTQGDDASVVDERAMF